MSATRACTVCNGDNPAAARFCMHCGAALPVLCGQCGTPAPDGARFCFACGSALTTADLAAPEPRPSPPAADDERKHITALFADLAGSTKLLAGRDPEDARQFLGAAMGELGAIVETLEGTVAKVMGDGLFAVFGAPLAQEDHAYRACLAAAEMHRRIAAVGHDIAPRARLRIGLDSGQAVVERIGEGADLRFDAIGEVVNKAAHLEAAATVGGTLIGEATRQLAGAAIECDQPADLPPRTFRLLRCRGRQESLTVSPEDAKFPFVGRRREIAFLRDAAAQLRDGQGQIITILGETGAGKTRFLAETLAPLADPGTRIISVAGREIDATNPDAVLKDIVYALLDARDRQDREAVTAAIESRLADLDLSSQSTRNACAWLLFGDAEPIGAEAAERLRAQAQAQVLMMLHRAAGARALILTVDNYQWVDESTRLFLNELAPAVARGPMLVLLACRADGRRVPDDLPRRQVLTLSALSETEAESLLDALLGGDDSVAPVRREIRKQAQDNPRFLVEAVRALRGQGVLSGAPGAHVLADADWDAGVPSTIADVFEARIDRLPAGAKRLMRIVSVYGAPISDGEAVTLMDGTAATVAGAFRAGTDAGLLETVEFLPIPRFSVANAAVGAACYRALVRGERQRLHGAICDLLQAEGGEAADDRFIGFHAHRSGRLALAARHLLRAGQQAYSRLAYGESADVLREAANANDQRTDDGPDRLRLALEIRLVLRDALFPRAAFDEIGQVLDESEHLADRLQDEPARRLVRRHRANHLLSVGRLPEARPVIEQLVADSADQDSPEEEIAARFLLLQILVAGGAFADARQTARWLLDKIGGKRLPDDGPESVLATLTRTWAIWCESELGAFEAAMPLVAETQASLMPDNPPFERILAGIGTGLFWLRGGHAELAAETLQTVLPLTERTMARAWFPSVASPLGLALARLGRAGEALPLLRKAIDETPYRHGVGRGLRLVHLGECYLALEQPSEALEVIQSGLRLAEQSQELGTQAYAMLAHAKCLHMLRRRADARIALDQAVAQADKLGMAPLIGECEALKACWEAPPG